MLRVRHLNSANLSMPYRTASNMKVIVGSGL